jgi:putative transcription factor
MHCEICGKDSARHRILLDGSELLVCSNCVSFGKELHKPVQKGFVKHMQKNSLQNQDTVLSSNFGKKIKTAREKKGLTIEELAKKIFEKESLMHKIEQGKFTPSSELSQKLEKELGIALEERIEEKSIEKKDSPRALTLEDLLEKKLEK